MDKNELVDSLRKELRHRGILKSITSQLKKEICFALTSPTCGFKYKPSASTIKSIEHGALRSLVFDFLHHDGMECTLSVFSTESGLDGNYLSSADVCKSFEIHSGSALHEILKVDRQECLNGGPRRIEHSTLYQLLSSLPRLLNDTSTQSTSTQTTNVNNDASKECGFSLLARQDLDRQLQQIKKKYSTAVPKETSTHHSSLIESRMFAFQAECEQRAQQRIEVEMKDFKRSTKAALEQQAAGRRLEEIEKVKQIMKIESEKKLEYTEKKQEQLSKNFLLKEREKEMQHMAEMHELMKEIDVLKKRDTETRNVIEIERLKLQRVKHLLMNAESKLDFAEAKEREVRESIANEFRRVRLAAKQTYDDASESVQKQMAFYAKELESLNALRKEAAKKINNNEALQIEVSELRVRNQELKNRVAAADAGIYKLERVLHESKKERSFKVTNLQRQLLDARESADCHRDEALSKNESNEQKLRKLQADLERAVFEKQLISEEVCDLRKLLMQSEGALQNIHADIGSETNIRYGCDVRRKRNLTQDRVQQILDNEAAKASARYRKDVAKVETAQQSYLKGNEDKLNALECTSPNCSLRISKPIQHEQASSIDSNPQRLGYVGFFPASLHCDNSARIELCDPPLNVVVQPLSVIDKGEGSPHSLDTFLTWESVNAIGCERNGKNHYAVAEQQEFPQLTLNEEIAGQLNKPKSHSNLPPESREEGEEEYGSDFEVESTQDCTKVDL